MWQDTPKGQMADTAAAGDSFTCSSCVANPS